MNYTRGGKETLDGIVRVWRRQLRVVASRYSPLQASLFCFGTVVINGSAFRFIVHFRRDWFSRHRFCCGLTLCANTPATIARVFVANYWCLFLEPSNIYIYIYILRRSPRQKLCRPFQRILPTIVSLYRQCSKLLRHRV